MLALEMNTPASVHDFKTRPYPERIPKFDYDSQMRVLKVTKNGSVRWGAYNWVCIGIITRKTHRSFRYRKRNMEGIL